MDEKELALIYRLMDESGLNAGNLSDANRPLHQIVNQIRTDLANKLKPYIRKPAKTVKVDYQD